MPGMDYEEMEIEVGRCLCGQNEVRILGSRRARPREVFAPVYDADDLHRRLESLDDLILGIGGDPSQRRLAAQTIGQELYGALLPGRVGERFEAMVSDLARRRWEGREVGLRLRLSFGSLQGSLAEAAGLPWELLCSPRTREFPARSAETSMVRYLEVPRPVRPPRTQPPLRILAVLTSPRNTTAIDRGRHAEALRRVAVPGRLEIHFPDEPSLGGMGRLLEEGRRRGEPFHALHFLGHGGFDDRGVGYLNFEDGSGRCQSLPADLLADLLRPYREVRWATLASCVTGRLSRHRGQHPFTGAATALLVADLSAVVAMQFPVTEDAMESFAGTFYRRLAEGRSLEESVADGRLAILTDHGDSLEWASPVLFLSSPDGKVLEAEETAARDVAAETPGSELEDRAPNVEPVSGGVSIHQHSNSGPQVAAARDLIQGHRGR